MLIVLKSGNLILLERSGPVQVCNGIALPLAVRLRKSVSTLVVRFYCIWKAFLRRMSRSGYKLIETSRRFDHFAQANA